MRPERRRNLRRQRRSPPAGRRRRDVQPGRRRDLQRQHSVRRQAVRHVRPAAGRRGGAVLHADPHSDPVPGRARRPGSDLHHVDPLQRRRVRDHDQLLRRPRSLVVDGDDDQRLGAVLRRRSPRLQRQPGLTARRQPDERPPLRHVRELRHARREPVPARQLDGRRRDVCGAVLRHAGVRRQLPDHGREQQAGLRGPWPGEWPLRADEQLLPRQRARGVCPSTSAAGRSRTTSIWSSRTTGTGRG